MANKDTNWKILISGSIGEYLSIRESRHPASKAYQCPGCKKEIRLGTRYCRLKVYKPTPNSPKKKEHIYDVPFHGGRCIDYFIADNIADMFVKKRESDNHESGDARFPNIEI
jgi:hypothetical protein